MPDLGTPPRKYIFKLWWFYCSTEEELCTTAFNVRLKGSVAKEAHIGSRLCKYLSKPCIKVDLARADKKLLDFTKAYEQLSGKNPVSPIIHLHLHYKGYIYDAGL